MSSDELQALLKKRGITKGQLTRFKTYLDKIDTDPTVLRQNHTIFSELKLRYFKFNSLLDDFNNIQSQIELLDKEEEVDERESFENNFYSLQALAQTIIDTCSNENSNASNNDHLNSTVIHNSSDSSLINSTLSHIKLPTISLPSFTGNFDEWLNFYDTFKSIIHENNSLTNIQKYHYLKSSIKGDAALIIQSLEISSDNYLIAWNLLKENFENKPRIINNHIKALFDLDFIHKESYVLLQQLLNDYRKHLRALKTLEQPTQHWDSLIVYLISTKLDNITKREWEKTKSELNHMPRIDELTNFLTKKCLLLESVETAHKKQLDRNQYAQGTSYTGRKEKQNIRSYVSVKKVICKFCKKDHPIHTCKSFLDLPVPQRIIEISNKKLCKNCFRHNHLTKDCLGSNCRKCNLKHNTLLHLTGSETNKQTNEPNSSDQVNDNNSINTVNQSNSNNACVGLNCSYSSETQVLLPTALAYVSDNTGNQLTVRILLDSASQANFITEDLYKKLGCTGKQTNFPIFGINNSKTNVLCETTIRLKSIYNSFDCNISCLVLPKITSNLPQSSFNATDLSIPNNLQLADPHFNKPGEIQILVGAGIFWSIICIGQIKLGKNLPVAQKTHFGWVISGSVLVPKTHEKYHNFLTCLSCTTTPITDDINIQQQLSMFWNLENVQSTNLLSKEENQCENYFLKTTTRNKNGQFVVRLPFKDNANKLGESYEIAKRRLFSLENRFEINPTIKEAYVTFMRDYLTLGHMSNVNYSESELKKAYFLPHHAVIKSDSITSKIRVVFDGSSKTTTGVSLNDNLVVGPTVQSDLFSIIMRFRLHPFAFISDCEKMYRQVIVHKDDRMYQTILWRFDKNEPLKTYQLNTVTYGTASAPFLATRCLLEISNLNKEIYPEASNIIKNDIYVDDLISGCSNIEDGKLIIDQINNLLQAAGFPLRKWSSNSPELLENIEYSNTIMYFTDKTDTIKTLGLKWNSKSDTFQFPVNLDNKCNVTKRSILSTISKIFDPLGLVGPITITAKILLQRLWQQNLTWDESIPSELYTIWNNYRSELSYLEQISIPRFILCIHPVFIQLHAFSDASETSYGTCIYLRSTNEKGQHTVNLLCAKSRVAPLKSITLPRLELCAAHLLAKLVNQIKFQLNITLNEYYFWCDSTIVLAWLQKPLAQLKPFVRNRVSDIIQLTDPMQWHHVRTHDNPADIISRGISPKILSNSSLWWNGPSWLSKNKSEWPELHTNISHDYVPEMKSIKQSFVSTINVNFMNELVCKYSNLKILQRTIAYMLRFINNCSCPTECRMFGPLSVTEIQTAMIYIVKAIQLIFFEDDINRLINKQPLSKNSKLLSLNPFLNSDQILCVGGRLINANLSETQKFPRLLPNKHHLTTLIIRDTHIKMFHAGTQAVLSNIRQNGYWPIAGLTAVRRILRLCIICRRSNPISYQPLMGNLPRDRVTPARPFLVCGTDFAGPFNVKMSKGRGNKTTKAYLCVFVCFSTKAVHLETVGDLSTESFIACLHRFIARRGLCHTIYSDNGTNYVGANNQLKQWYKFANKESHNINISNFLTSHSINWKFNPARSPHFGGLWESVVKSVKRHLHRVTFNHNFTFEELSTLFAQIEAILNSRPLIPVSSDPRDFNFLSPGHFLIGDSLLALPEPNLLESKLTRLKRFQMLQHLHQQFWSKWSTDYINLLQSRSKWRQQDKRTLKEGTLVLMRENTPPLTWKVGRISQLHTGQDGTVRVVTVKTANGFVKRAVMQLCELLDD